MKERIRQEMYYCMKYGIAEHMKKTGKNENQEKYVANLLGRINYVLSVEPDNEQMKQYRNWLKISNDEN